MTLFKADGTPMKRVEEIDPILTLLAKFRTAIVPGHIPAMLTAVKLDSEEGSIQVLVPNEFLPLVANAEFRATMVEAVSAQLDEMAAHVSAMERKAEVDAKYGDGAPGAVAEGESKA